MVRTTISIPDDLKTLMDEGGETVNWSAVAADAFRRRLRELKEGNMDAVIERLRASKEKRGLDYFALGEARGIEWAKRRAEYGDLRRLERFDIVDMIHSFSDAQKFTWAEQIAFTILPGPGTHTRAEAAAFWKSTAGVLEPEHLKSVKFLQGFIRGAVAIYEQVNSALK